jgi:hypothetical protein
MAMSNGAQVMGDRTVKMKNETETHMKDGQIMMMDGHMMNGGKKPLDGRRLDGRNESLSGCFWWKNALSATSAFAEW